MRSWHHVTVNHVHDPEATGESFFVLFEGVKGNRQGQGSQDTKSNHKTCRLALGFSSEKNKGSRREKTSALRLISFLLTLRA